MGSEMCIRDRVEPAAPAADEPSASKKKEGPEQQLLQGLSDGEDLGEPGEAAANPLAKIGQQMRDVERAISQRQADQETRRRQARIVRELDDLIRQAQQQNKNNSNKSNSNNNRSTAGMERSGGQNQQQPARRPDVAQPGANAGEGKSAAAGAARDSEKRTTEQQSQKPDMVKMRDVLKGVWGELPERRREQMLQSYEEQFLPKYEQMIADYFRSLSDEKERKR